MNIALRQAVESDIDFLVELRNSTMRDYLEEIGMPISLEDYLDRIQYRFDCAQIVTLDDVPIGLFKAEFQPENNLWYLIQIQIHPGYQNAKIGTHLIHSLIEKAKQSSASVGLSVIKTNPAYKLYQSLGFEKIGENQYEYELELKA
ncbi:GNAT family N-acetyltransferase [Vibrio atypicus]|jgi:ribosomal protein S18 acetylase RimI-like enzyme|uniref:GNAT family N-acetyltransferase n=1 Tax=Vibrio atypicus TaxID=558271 RepID=UPI00135BB462|nr:GNAT family N-acetyltransferase [Vibrio atypicus]